MRSAAVIALITLGALAACNKEKPASADASSAAAPAPAAVPGGTPIESTNFASALHVNLRSMLKSADGLYSRDITVGTGASVVAGSVVSAKYVGNLPDGSQFDAGTYTFTLGDHGVIAGWEEGTLGMKVGGKRQLLIPPALGYGAGGSPPVIPPNAVLVFTIEVVSST